MNKQILDVIANYGYASVPLLQSACNISYKEASKALDELLQEGLVNFSDKLIYTINQSKFFKAYGELCENPIGKKQDNAKLDFDAKLNEYKVAFYKKALLYVIKTQEVRPIGIATHFHVNALITLSAVTWMKLSGFVEDKPNKYAQILITERQFFEKFGALGEDVPFEKLYKDALYLCIKNKTYSKEFIARNFVTSYRQLEEFDEWMEKNGYKDLDAAERFILTQQAFLKKCGVEGDFTVFTNAETKKEKTVEIDDDEDDYYDEEDEDEIDEDEIRKIIEDNLPKTDSSEENETDEEDELDDEFDEDDEEEIDIKEALKDYIIDPDVDGEELEDEDDDSDDETDETETLREIKEFYQNGFSAVFDDTDDPYKGSIKSNGVTIIEFRLRIDGNKIYLSDCGNTVCAGKESDAQPVINRYDNVYLAEGEIVVEFNGTDRAGNAMIILCIVIERVNAIFRK